MYTSNYLPPPTSLSLYKAMLPNSWPINLAFIFLIRLDLLAAGFDDAVVGVVGDCLSVTDEEAEDWTGSAGV